MRYLTFGYPFRITCTKETQSSTQLRRSLSQLPKKLPQYLCRHNVPAGNTRRPQVDTHSHASCGIKNRANPREAYETASTFDESITSRVCACVDKKSKRQGSPSPIQGIKVSTSECPKRKLYIEGDTRLVFRRGIHVATDDRQEIPSKNTFQGVVFPRESSEGHYIFGKYNRFIYLCVTFKTPLCQWQRRLR